MLVTVEELGRLVVLSGRLDVTTVADVRLALHDAVDAVPDGDLVVDVGSTEISDATGLGVLVGAHRRAGRAGRRLVLRDVQAPLSRLLWRTRLARVLHLESPSTPASVA